MKFQEKRINLRAAHRQKRMFGAEATPPKVVNKKNKTQIFELDNFVITFKNNGSTSQEQAAKWLIDEIKFFESIRGNKEPLGEM